MSLQMSESGIGFRDSNGNIVRYRGIKLRSAIVFSPLVELGGSGLMLTHPQGIHEMAQRTVCEVTYGESNVRNLNGLISVPVGTHVKYGDPLVWRPNPAVLDPQGEAILFWKDIVPGIVSGAAVVDYELDSGNVTIRLEALAISRSALVEKLRGVCKGTGDGGFNRNIQILNADGRVVYDPTHRLYNEAGQLVQCEIVYGAEEAKTLNAAIDMIGAVFANGQWEDEAALIGRLEDNLTTVDVVIVGVEENCYAMLKSLHAGKRGFEFDDHLRRVSHSGAYAFIGNATYIVEVPLTATFCGKTSFYYEHVEAMAVRLPALVDKIDELSEKNRSLVSQAIDCALATDHTQYVWLTTETVIERSEGVSNITIADHLWLGKYISRLVLPGYVDAKQLRNLQKCLKHHGYRGMGLYADCYGGEKYVYLNLDMFARLQGDASSMGFQKLSSIFGLLTWVDGAAPNSYDQGFGRNVAALAGIVDKLVVEGRNLMKGMTKSIDIGITMRARASIFVEMDAIHVSPTTANYLGLQDGHYVIFGRIPIPGSGVVRVVVDEAAPDWVAFVNPLMKHRVEEGDVDGDQLTAIVVDENGELVEPGSHVKSVVVAFAD
jgi:hypothetical protein